MQTHKLLHACCVRMPDQPCHQSYGPLCPCGPACDCSACSSSLGMGPAAWGTPSLIGVNPICACSAHDQSERGTTSASQHHLDINFTRKCLHGSTLRIKFNLRLWLVDVCPEQVSLGSRGPKIETGRAVLADEQKDGVMCIQHSQAGGTRNFLRSRDTHLKRVYPRATRPCIRWVPQPPCVVRPLHACSSALLAQCMSSTDLLGTVPSTSLGRPHTSSRIPSHWIHCKQI